MSRYKILVARPDGLVDTVTITADAIDGSAHEDMIVFSQGACAVFWVNRNNLVYVQKLPDLATGGIVGKPYQLREDEEPTFYHRFEGASQRLDDEAAQLKGKMEEAARRQRQRPQYSSGGPVMGELGGNCA